MNDDAKYISIHSIHTYPYANLNRDDLGSPKSLMMGGVNRIRISSQCMKRSVRRWAEEEGTLTASIRTREIDTLINSRLAEGELLSEADREVAAGVVGFFVKKLSGSGNVLAFFGQSEVNRLVNMAASMEGAASWSKKEISAKEKDKDLESQVENILSRAEAGVALFGRMFAMVPKVSVDGAVQMAHAFTVHEALAELDYFTAVEDWVADRDHDGAGHLSTNEFSSGTFYKYANVGIRELLENLEGDSNAATDLIAAFVRGFVLADPSGKQTGTAARTLPDLVYVAIENMRPVSLASAFEKPVRSRDGFRVPAIELLNDEAKAVADFLGGPVSSAHTCLVDAATASLGDRVGSVDELVAVAKSSVE